MLISWVATNPVFIVSLNNLHSDRLGIEAYGDPEEDHHNIHIHIHNIRQTTYMPKTLLGRYTSPRVPRKLPNSPSSCRA